MKFQLKQDDDITVQKRRIGRVPTLVIKPARIAAAPVAVLWIHGGGFMLGMKEMVYMSRSMDLVKKYGSTVFSPGYRLAWQKPYPAAVDDCYAVLEHIDKHRADLKIEKIMVGGESAGGGLAAAVCMLARDRGIRVDYQTPLYPMMSNIDTDSSRDNHGKVWNTRRNHLGWRLYLRSDARKRVSPYAAPAQQTDYSGLPPCYTFVGDGEPFYRETLDYVSALRAGGVCAEADVYLTDLHAFDMLRPDDELSKEAARRFNEHFEKILMQDTIKTECEVRRVMKLSVIFEDKPKRWGFRGDPYFWDHLKELAEDMEILAPDELENWIREEYLSLSGKVLTDEYMDFAKIEQFAHGGMSSGGVDNQWWMEEGIPLLKDRLSALSQIRIPDAAAPDSPAEGESGIGERPLSEVCGPDQSRNETVNRTAEDLPPGGRR